MQETHTRPALILGTSSDRIGTPSGQSYYITASKSLKESTGAPIAPYAGLAWGTYDDRLRAIGGLNITFGGGFSALLIFDGVHFHPTLNWSRGRHTLTGLLARSQDPGIAYSVSF